MHAFFPPTLAQAGTDSGIIFFVLAMAVAVAILGYIAWDQYRKRHAALARNHGLQLEIARLERGSHDRDRQVYEQHVRLNELQIAKLTAEVELLQQQVQHKATDDDRLEAGKEYHELMVEKVRLEMDSLRLQIAEQRRRTEDWRSED